MENFQTLDLIAYSYEVSDKLLRDYRVKIPRPYSEGGVPNSYCVAYVAQAYAENTSIADAAFVLCNKIQRRAWEEETVQ